MGASSAGWQAYIEASDIEGDLQSLLSDLDAKSVDPAKLENDLEGLQGDMGRLERMVEGIPLLQKSSIPIVQICLLKSVRCRKILRKNSLIIEMR